MKRMRITLQVMTVMSVAVLCSAVAFSDGGTLSADREQTREAPAEFPRALGPHQPVSPLSAHPEQTRTAPVGDPRAPILDGDSAQISFQAILTDNQGAALPGPVNLEFRLYSLGGGLLESVVMNGVALADGIVDVMVPFTPANFDGDGREVGVSVDGGAELAPRMRIAAVPYAFRVDRVASDELDDTIALGDANTNGQLDVFNGTFANAVTARLDGVNNRFESFLDTGNFSSQLGGFGSGFLRLYDTGDGATNDITVELLATNNSGGEMSLRDTDGSTRSLLASPPAGGTLSLFNAAGDATVHLDASDHSVTASLVNVVDAATGFGGGLANFPGLGTLMIVGDENNDTVLSAGADGAGGLVTVHQADSTITVSIDGDATDANGGSEITLFNSAGGETVNIDGDLADGGEITLSNSAGGPTVFLDGDSGDDGLLTLLDANGDSAIQLHSDNFSSAPQISMHMRDSGGTLRETVEIVAAETSTTGSQIRLRDAAGNATIVLDAEFNPGGPGRVTTGVLEITGGADLSENFDVSDDCAPGQVVCIDPDEPGRLTVSTKAYDRTVAGIISGAGGVNTGMLMGQRGTEVDGRHPVALSGRVYCRVDETGGKIQPGDLLTTSPVRGCCMKVSDPLRAHGAIIGKAMSRSKDGLVLVLVSLQ